jgi:hypothetical protein
MSRWQLACARGNVILFLAPVLLDEDSLHGRSHKVDSSHPDKKVANWPSQAGDRGSEFQSEFMINNSLDYDFLREKCCVHHMYTFPRIEGWSGRVFGAGFSRPMMRRLLIPVLSPCRPLFRNHRDELQHRENHHQEQQHLEMSQWQTYTPR